MKVQRATRIFGSILLLLLSSEAGAQQTGTPDFLRVRVDANNSLVVASATQVNPVNTFQFTNARLATDASNNLKVVITGTVTPTFPLLAPDGTSAAPSYSFTNETGSGLFRVAANDIGFSIAGTKTVDFLSTGTTFTGVVTTANGTGPTPSINVGTSTHGFYQAAGGAVCGTSDGTNNPTGCSDGTGTNYQFDVPVLAIGGTLPTGNSANVYLMAGSSGNLTIGNSASTANVNVKLGALSSGTNCNSSASPAVCGSAIAGSVALAAGGTTLVVNTTAVTANSQILITDDSGLGTRLSVTCNTTIPTASVSARTAGTSFTITVAAAPTTNPACFSYLIVN